MRLGEGQERGRKRGSNTSWVSSGTAPPPQSSRPSLATADGHRNGPQQGLIAFSLSRICNWESTMGVRLGASLKLEDSGSEGWGAVWISEPQQIREQTGRKRADTEGRRKHKDHTPPADGGEVCRGGQLSRLCLQALVRPGCTFHPGLQEVPLCWCDQRRRSPHLA